MACQLPGAQNILSRLRADDDERDQDNLPQSLPRIRSTSDCVSKRGATRNWALCRPFGTAHNCIASHLIVAKRAKSRGRRSTTAKEACVGGQTYRCAAGPTRRVVQRRRGCAQARHTLEESFERCGSVVDQTARRVQP